MNHSQDGNIGSDALTPSQSNLPGPVVRTPQGPAVVQVIDIPGEPAQSGGRRGGSSLVRAALRRWWLVLLTAVLVGGTGMVLAGRYIQPTWEARARVLYQTVLSARSTSTIAADPGDIVRAQMDLVSSPPIVLRAARRPEVQAAFPWLKGLDLNNPAVQKDVARRLRDVCDASMVNPYGLIEIHTSQSDPIAAAAVANAFADAFVEYCSNQVLGQDGVRRRKLQEQIDQLNAMLNELQKNKNQLVVANDFAVRDQQKATLIAQIGEYQKLKTEADIKRIAAQAELERYLKNANGDGGLNSAMQLARKLRIEEETNKDPLLQAATSEQSNAYYEYMRQLGLGKMPEHRDVIYARQRLERAEAAVALRQKAIAQAIDNKIADQQKLLISANVEQAQANLRAAEAAVKAYETRLAGMNQEAVKLAIEKQKVDQLDDAINRVKQQYNDMAARLQALNLEQQSVDAIIAVADPAVIPMQPTDDKRIKAQAASILGGLFLGVLLALLVDRFDRRVRNPDDLEERLKAPMLGMVPKVQEIKSERGDMARHLVAEEFRAIRTQLLFGGGREMGKTLCITSPAPGDGKTSLAVNLAISFARSGRRVLLIDADLQKPDIHRIFKMQEAPGFSELIQRTAEPIAAIRHTEVAMLDVLPAGMALARPCELLSRPEVSGLLATLGEMYDHIFLDTAPLLPVCDTHVLAGRTDGVICAFSDGVDTETVDVTGRILRRSSARLIGTVLNQVGYKQSTSYHRGRLAYSSYYSYGAGRLSGEQQSAGSAKA